MSETRKTLGVGALAVIPIVCCVGIPLIAAAGISVAVAAWAGGIAVGTVVLAAVVILLGVRARRRRSRQAPPLSMTRSRP
jgi:O-antigen/teichoic acid export membrane protein